MMKALVIICNQAREPYPVIPIGGVILANLLDQRGVEVTFVDLCFSENPKEDVQEALKEPHDIGLISFRNLNNHDQVNSISYLPFLYSICDVLEKNLLPFYIGGPAVTIAPETILNKSGADGVFVGSALSFVNRLMGNDPIKGVIEDWSEDSFVAHKMESWVDVDRYLKYERMVPLRLKRGCPFKCSYCNYKALEGAKSYLPRDESLVKFIRHWFDKGVGIDIVDSIFNAPEQYAIDVCEWLAKEKLVGNYHISAFTPAVQSSRLLESMSNIGATKGMIGIDGGCDEMLETYNKPFRMKHIDRFLELRKCFDHKYFWTFLIGGPNESISTIEKTMRFIDRLPETDPVYLTVGVRMYPDTDLHRMAIKEGKRGSQSIDEPLYYISDHLDMDEVYTLLSRWSQGNHNVLLASETYDDKYQRAIEMATVFGSESPGWQSIPFIKKIMLRAAQRRS